MVSIIIVMQLKIKYPEPKANNNKTNQSPIERCSIINVDKDVVPRDCVDSSFPFFCEFACGTGIDPLDNKHRMI